MQINAVQPNTLDDVRLRRAKLSLRFGIYMLFGNGIFWFAFNLIMEGASNLFLDLLMFFIVGLLFYFYHKLEYKIVAQICYWIFFVFVTLVCIYDFPEPGVPRSQHLFFITIAMYPYILLYQEKIWVRIIPSVLALGAFVFFSFSDFSISTDAAVAVPIRQKLAILITISACLSIAGMIYILHADMRTRDKSGQELAEAIFNKQLELFYQPQVDAEGRIVAAEALIRWKHPTLGLLTPDKFIPYAEKSGIILPIGNWVLHEACRQLASWQKKEEAVHIELSINISAKEFQDEKFVANVIAAIEQYEIDASKLIIEITESALIHDIEDVIKKIEALNEVDVQFSLDDLGTGYSSLNLVKDLPLAEIKIDKSFVADITQDTLEMPVTDVLLSLGEAMSVHSVAEGIETVEQWHYLSNKGCKYFQGFLFGKPMEVQKFNQLLSHQHYHKKEPLTHMASKMFV